MNAGNKHSCKPWFVSMAEAIKHGLIEELTQQSMSRIRPLTD